MRRVGVAALVSLGAPRSKAVRSPLATDRRDAVGSRIESATVGLGDLTPVGGRSLDSPLPGHRDDEHAKRPSEIELEGGTRMRWSGLVKSVGALALLFVTASATAQWTKSGQQGDVAWRAAEHRRQQLIEEMRLQHQLWYLQHLQELRQAEESRLAGKQEGAEA